MMHSELKGDRLSKFLHKPIASLYISSSSKPESNITTNSALRICDSSSLPLPSLPTPAW
ncbi:MAG: hypothetical protein HC833_19300 [Leptolyngbyaceae cyanobacterium RM1_406_9]|nr:hypothetical protein [Leptolyngbyaceae cyanobacterium RM1_406_9]